MQAIPQTLSGPYWRDLYAAAFLEHDPARLRERIADAELALILREHELFRVSGDHIEEKSAIEDAMYTLHALRNARREVPEFDSPAFAA